MIDAKEFAKAGQKYLGTPYSIMDCQAFVERCMADCGLKKDLKGSNAWYREMDWTGSPEECKKVFSSVPTGALLFIWADDGGEVARGYKDGLGNASHIGIVTHTGKGAIHSSSSRGEVAESRFKDKTISNGGWNRIGLSQLFDYGAHINSLLSGENTEVIISMEYATVFSENGLPVKLRPTKSTSLPWLTQIPVGTQLLITEHGSDWCGTSFDGHEGYVMTKFLRFDGDTVGGSVQISLDRTHAEALYGALKSALGGESNA